MSIYRGVGGVGDATNDVTTNTVTQKSIEAAASAAEALLSEQAASASATSADVAKIEWKGAWTIGTPYALNDAVFYAATGSSYINKQAGTGNAPADGGTANWDELAVKGGEAGIGTGDLLSANNLSDVASASTARTNLGLVIGTNVFAEPTDTTAGKILVANGNDFVSVAVSGDATISSAGAVSVSLTASNIASSAVGAIVATDVQAALQELDTEKEPADSTILKDADIGVNVQAYDATYVVDADIGVTVQAYDATYVVDADIGSSVQAYDATILNDADIGVNVQAYDADIPVVVASQAEMEAGTVTANRTMNPAGVKQAINALVGVTEITSMSRSMLNVVLFIRAGKLLSATGNSAQYPNHCSGRGLDATQALYSLQHTTEVTFPSQVAGTTVVQAGGDGLQLAYARMSNNYLYVWGKNSTGSLGLGNTTAQGAPVLALTDCTEVYDDNTWGGYDADKANLFVKREDGFVYAAGDNNYGEFGLGNTTQFNTFQKLTWIGTNPKFVRGAEGRAGSLLVQKSDGTIWTVGNGINGTRFDSLSTNTSTATDVTTALGGSTAGDVIFSHYKHGYFTTSAANLQGARVVRKDSSNVTRMFTVGNNGMGQLGNGNTTTSTAPYEVTGMGDIADITVNGGSVTSIFVLRTGGDLVVWGRNNEGQLGVGDTTNRTSPTVAATGVTEIMTKNSVSHSYEWAYPMFIRKGTDIYGTGYNAHYELGVGTVGNKSSFTLNPLLSNAGDRVKMVGRMVTTTLTGAIIAVLESNDIMVWGYGAQEAFAMNETAHVRFPFKMKIL